mmetsp:Transcript_31523/g.68140  ORF Transcript_31523/g.68140 Transcript_31523/m.68140 type:complete len:262 (-) Transcript_31523:1127-1912(-)
MHSCGPHTVWAGGDVQVLGQRAAGVEQQGVHGGQHHQDQQRHLGHGVPLFPSHRLLLAAGEAAGGGQRPRPRGRRRRLQEPLADADCRHRRPLSPRCRLRRSHVLGSCQGLQGVPRLHARPGLVHQPPAEQQVHRGCARGREGQRTEGRGGLPDQGARHIRHHLHPSLLSLQPTSAHHHSLLLHHVDLDGQRRVCRGRPQAVHLQGAHLRHPQRRPRLPRDLPLRLHVPADPSPRPLLARRHALRLRDRQPGVGGGGAEGP